MKVESLKELYNLIQKSSIIGIISDLDGTLIHSAPLHKKAYQAAFQKFGCVFYDDIWEHESMYGGTEWLKKMLVLGGVGDVSSVAHKIKEYKYEWFARHTDELEVMQEIKEFLCTLHQTERFHIACVTAAGLSGAESMLRHTGMDRIFEYLVTSDTMPKGKNKFDASVYADVAKSFQVSPELCLVLDDNELCIKTAQEAGMSTYFIPERIAHFVL